MKVEIGQQPNTPQPQAPIPSKGKVVVSANPVRVREMLDKDGNVIDPKSKQIIRLAKDNQ